jgi:hypothetical protein
VTACASELVRKVSSGWGFSREAIDLLILPQTRQLISALDGRDPSQAVVSQLPAVSCHWATRSATGAS